MRVYIPSTWPMLRKLVAGGKFDPVGGTAFALTPRLRESYVSGEEDELEYAAMGEAAPASLRLLASSSGSARTRHRPAGWWCRPTSTT